MKITDKQQRMLSRVYELAHNEIETASEQPLPGSDNPPQWDDANLVEHVFHVAVMEMQQELILSDPAKVRELKQREENAMEARAAHEEEASRLGAEFGNFGWSSGDYGDWFVITSKTSRGRFSTSRHAKTGEVEHFWHDVE
jgi:hypothetical protein